MTSDQYLKSLVFNKKANPIELNDIRLYKVCEVIKKWSGDSLSRIIKSGSNAKQTAVKGIADLDLFISLKSENSINLKDIYNSLDSAIKSQGWQTRRQNVSIGIIESGINIDLIPGKIQPGYLNFHSIYTRKKDTWLQTNIDMHVSKVLESKRQSEIILAKIWRELNQIDFPSIYLELVILEALKFKIVDNISHNFLTVLKYLSENFLTQTFIDPANTNNTISDMLSLKEKEKICNCATLSLEKKFWNQIVY